MSSTRKWISALVASSVTFALASATSCQSGATGAGGASSGSPDAGYVLDPSIADVVFEGYATDDALFPLLHVALVNDPTAAARLSFPPDAGALAVAPPPTFSWTAGATALRIEPSPLRRAVAAPVVEAPTGRIRWGLPRAWAHGTPTSGPAYFLTFSTPTSPKLVRVFTTNLTYTPDAAHWARLVNAKTAIRIVIVDAELDQNRIAPGGGPWQGSDTTFTVQ